MIARGRKNLLGLKKVQPRRRPVAPELQQFLQALGDGGGVPMVPPVIAVLALRQHIVQLQKIDDPIPAIPEAFVEAARDDIHEIAIGGQIVANHRRRQFHQRQGRSLQRFDESRGHAHGHAVAMPERFQMAGLEAELSKFEL